MSITLCNASKTPVKFITFSDGSEAVESLANTEVMGMDQYVSVVVEIEDCTRDLVRIGLVKDALDRLDHFDKIHLMLKYMPQARADRVFSRGMALPVAVFAKIINSFKFDQVFIDDPHSDVTPALLDNVQVSTQDYIFANHVHLIKHQFENDFILCAPDLGATKKIFDVVKGIGHTDYIQAVKIRDVMTGNIVKCEVEQPDKVKGKNILIVDDIADGGASFKFLAQKLKQYGAKRVGLYVTHGIFAKGLDELYGSIDYIYVNNYIGNYINPNHVHRFNKGEA